MLTLMLAQVLESGDAESAADGWGADRYVAWQNGGQTCVRLSIDMDTPEKVAEMGQALADLGHGHPGRHRARGRALHRDPLRLSSAPKSRRGASRGP